MLVIRRLSQCATRTLLDCLTIFCQKTKIKAFKSITLSNTDMDSGGKPLRSVSTGEMDIQFDSGTGKPLGLNLTISKKALSSKINSAPQDYIFVDGAPYKRSPRSSVGEAHVSPRSVPAGAKEYKKQEAAAGAALLASKGLKPQPEDDPEHLRTLLTNAHSLIERQKLEIRARDERIFELEASLRSRTQSAGSEASMTSGSSGGSRVLNRIRNDVVHGNTGDLPPTPDKDDKAPEAKVPSPGLHSLSLKFNGGGADDSRPPPSTSSMQMQSVATTSSSSSPSIFITPTSADSLEGETRANPYPFTDIPAGGDGHTSGESPNSTVGAETGAIESPAASALVDIGGDAFKTPTTGVTGKAPKGLAARLAMSASERRRLAEQRSGSGSGSGSGKVRSNGVIKARRGVTPDTVVKEAPRYKSAMAHLTPRTAAQTSHVYLFHDNPQLGSSVAAKLEASEGCGIMLESKVEESEKSRFLVGRVIYSGAHQTMPGIKAAALANPRGSQCIQVLCAFAVQCELKKLTTRVKGNILEIDLRGDHTESFDVTTPEEITSFLEPCKARVDVVLDPIRDGFWFPYWEARRKMAPQFRSQGMGYIRLGDDMSRNGTAFLSVDRGLTFLDDGAYDDDAEAAAGAFSGRSTFPGRPNRRSFSAGANTSNSSMGKTVGVTSGLPDADTADMSHDMTSGEREEQARRIVTQLADASDGMKWAERQTLLRRLYDTYADAPDTSLLPVRDTISVLVSCITRHKNPHVLRSAIACVRVVGDSISVLTVNAMAWRHLLVETINVLKNGSKAVMDETRQTLNYLHSKAVIKLASVPTLCEDIFGSSRAPSRGGLGTPTSRSSPRSDAGRSGGATPTPSTPSGATNCGRIVAWLVEVARRELSMGFAEMARFRSSQGALSQPVHFYDECDAGGLAMRSAHLLAHREESTRAAGCDFIAGLLALDVFNAVGATGDLAGTVAILKRAAGVGGRRNMDGARRRVSGSPQGVDTSVNDFSDCAAALNELLSPSGKEALGEILRMAPRAVDKTAAAVCDLMVSVNDEKRSLQTDAGAVGKAPPARAARPISGSAVTGSASSSATSQRVVRRTSQLKPPSPVDDSDATPTSEAIFFEASMVLKTVPKTGAEWENLCSVVEMAPRFFKDLDTTAARLSLARGALIRSVLPFDEYTSSNDQAAGGSGDGQELAALVQSAAAAGVDKATVLNLREEALIIRKLIRVKMADEADVNQAIQAMAIVDKFRSMVECRSRLEDLTPSQVLASLE